MKVATNQELFEKKPHWMDFNAGRLLYEPMEDVLADFIQAIIAVASGPKPVMKQTMFEKSPSSRMVSLYKRRKEEANVFK